MEKTRADEKRTPSSRPSLACQGRMGPGTDRRFWNKARGRLALWGISTALNSARVACLKRGEALSEINVSSSLTSIDKSKPTLETHQNREP